jgi:hypothetical protein
VRDQLNDANSIYYGYDANDRLTFASMTAATSTVTQATFNYTTGTNHLANIVDGTGTRSISYDGRGNTIQAAKRGDHSCASNPSAGTACPSSPTRRRPPCCENVPKMRSHKVINSP